MMTTEKIAMHWINGEWVDSNPHRESIDPATYQVIGSYADGGVEVAAAAIAAARRAFETTEWKRDASLRARVLEELAASFEEESNFREDNFTGPRQSGSYRFVGRISIHKRASHLATWKVHATHRSGIGCVSKGDQ
jgi:Aldehyde dehydrogenase family